MNRSNIFVKSEIAFTHDLTFDQGRWLSNSDDPYFLFNKDLRLRNGWHKIFLRMEADAEANPKVYFDFGNQFNEMECVSLKQLENHTFAAVVKFPQIPSSIRFDPLDQTGSVQIDELSIKPMSHIRFLMFAIKRAVSLFVENPGENLPRIKRSAMSLLTQPRFQKITPTLITGRGKDSFELWRESFDYDPVKHRDKLQETIELLPQKPKISILMPVYNTDKDLLNLTIKSVLNQTYPNWELCICDDSSTKKHIKNVLDKWAEKDSRIKVHYRTKNGHISKASNSALKLVTSDWVALLDHDDILTENALAEIAIAIDRNPSAAMFYSDEDKINEKGNRFDPHFKPDFSPDLFRSMNYLNHLTVHKTENIKKVGGWRHDFVGSQDYDLNLRIWECIRDDQIVHIPKILYHWRAVQGSTALSGDEKNYTVDAGLRALKEHFVRRGVAARVSLLPDAPFFRVKYDLPEPLPLVSLIIPTKDGVDLIKDCVRSIYEKSDYPNFEIIIVNNNSEKQESLDYFEVLKRTGVANVVDYPHPFNFSAINNYGVKFAKGSIIGLVNNDIEAITLGWLREMVSWVAQDRVGCVGAKLYYSDNKIQHAGVILGIGGVAGHAHKHMNRDSFGYFSRAKVAQNLSAVTAACLLVRKSVYEEVDGLNVDNLSIAFNDIDFCLKVHEAGYLNVWTPFAEMYHYESISRGAEDNPEKVKRFNSEIDYMLQTWSKELASDPYYSPNLTITKEDFSIKNC